MYGRHALLRCAGLEFVPSRRATSLTAVLPWLAHAYTALGAAAGLAAALAVIDADYRATFAWFGVALFIDSTDGVLARALRVKERLPFFDGARLDDIIDYVTYVFVPVLLVIHAGLLPDDVAVWVGAAVLMASGYGFSRTDAKVGGAEFFFTGFPSYWNLVALYLYVWRLPPIVNAALLLFLALMVFVPLRYVYPSRTVTLSALTNVFGALWALLLMWVVYKLPDTSGPWITLSLIFPIYYVALSLWLHARHRS